jgi:short-subunit dehydrogenase
VLTGASSGIGTHMARELARRNHGLTLVARREERLHALAAELRDAHGVRVEVVAADLADDAGRGRMAGEIHARGLTVDVLVNNAGFGTTGPVRDADRTREIAMIRTDVEAVVDLCTRFVAGMVERGAGAILNVASTAAFQPIPGQAAYAACKAFVLSYTHALAAELAGTGVTATVLCPGPVDTEFAATAGFSDEEAGSALPTFMWVPVEKVAADAIAGLAAGRRVVIPGAANRVGAVAGHLAPRRLVTALAARRHPALHR